MNGAADDETLAALANKGDQKACDFLLDKFKPLVRSVTRPYFLAGADREDILQEGMIGLYKAIQNYDQGKNVSFAVFAELCIRRQVITAVKSATRQKHTPLNNYVSISKMTGEEDEERDPEELLDYSLLSDEMIDPEEIVIDQESNELLDYKLRRCLSELERKVLDLFVGGDSYQEIAQALGKDPKSIDNALQRIKKKLRDIL